MEAILVATLRRHCPDCRGLARAPRSIDAMKVPDTLGEHASWD